MLLLTLILILKSIFVFLGILQNTIFVEASQKSISLEIHLFFWGYRLVGGREKRNKQAVTKPPINENDQLLKVNRRLWRIQIPVPVLMRTTLNLLDVFVLFV